MKTEYKSIIDNLCANIHTDLVDFAKPRSRASMPTQVSSEFITNKQQGDWAENVLFRAINENSQSVVAVKYGKSDNLVAGEKGFDAFFNDYQSELDAIGKRPDLLLFKKEDFNAQLGFDISSLPENEIHNYVATAIAGIEVRSSAFLINKYMQEVSKMVNENQNKALELRDVILRNYSDLLAQKREEMIPLLESLNDKNLRTISFRVPTWRASKRLHELSSLLSEMKDCLKVIQKRNNLSITPKVEDLKVVHKF